MAVILKRKALSKAGLQVSKFGHDDNNFFSPNGSYFSCCAGVMRANQTSKSGLSVLASRTYRGGARAGRKSWVKDTNSLNSSQESYISKKKREAAAQAERNQYLFLEDNSPEEIKRQQLATSRICTDCTVPRIGPRIYPYTGIKYFNPIGRSQSEYMHSKLQLKKDLPTPPDKRAFPMVLNNTYCANTIYTYKQAKQMGLYKDCNKCKSRKCVNKLPWLYIQYEQGEPKWVPEDHAATLGAEPPTQDWVTEVKSVPRGTKLYINVDSQQEAVKPPGTYDLTYTYISATQAIVVLIAPNISLQIGVWVLDQQEEGRDLGSLYLVNMNGAPLPIHAGRVVSPYPVDGGNIDVSVFLGIFATVSNFGQLLGSPPSSWDPQIFWKPC